MAMNLKKVQAKLAALKAEKEKAEKKKAETIKELDAQIADLTAQIRKFDNLRATIERLQKQLEEQFDMADELAAGPKPAKKTNSADEDEDEDESIDDADEDEDEDDTQPNSLFGR
jgi:predicted RNase H-like nuclease (RuvC/YqgF family)